MSNKSEQDILKSVGAKVHSNSGRGWINKADGSNAMFVIDVKEASKSFTLNEKVWSKVCTDAYKTNPYKLPALLVSLGVENKKELAIIEWSVLQSLIESADDDYPRRR